MADHVTGQREEVNQATLKRNREANLCLEVRRWLRDNALLTEVSDEVLLKRLRHPYETDRRAKEQMKRGGK